MAVVPAPSQHLRASARSLGGTLLHEVSIDGGRHILVTDEPAELGGGDAGPAPHELLPAALAACVSTTVQMYARMRGWSISDTRVDVDYDHRSSPRRLSIELHLDGVLSDAQLARLEKVAASCPVRRAIESGVVCEERVVRNAGRGAA